MLSSASASKSRTISVEGIDSAALKRSSTPRRSIGVKQALTGQFNAGRPVQEIRAIFLVVEGAEAEVAKFLLNLAAGRTVWRGIPRR